MLNAFFGLVLVRCVFYSKPLLESGTLGTKCNVQVAISLDGRPSKAQPLGDVDLMEHAD